MNVLSRSHQNSRTVSTGEVAIVALARILAVGFMVAVLPLSACSDFPTEKPGLSGQGAYRVVNLIPDITSVSTTLGDVTLSAGLAFAEATTYQTIDAGDYVVEFRDVGADTVLVWAQVGVRDGKKSTIVAYGDTKVGRAKLAFVDVATSIGPDSLRVRVVHTATRAGKLTIWDVSDPSNQVELYVDTVDTQDVSAPLAYGNLGEYLDLPAGTYSIGVNKDQAVFTLPALSAGSIVNIYTAVEALAPADTLSWDPIGDGVFFLLLQMPEGPPIRVNPN